MLQSRRLPFTWVLHHKPQVSPCGIPPDANASMMHWRSGFELAVPHMRDDTGTVRMNGITWWSDLRIKRVIGLGRESLHRSRNRATQ